MKKESFVSIITDHIAFHVEEVYNHNEPELTEQDIKQLINEEAKENDVNYNQSELNSILQECIEYNEWLMKELSTY